ncbi:DUF2716 domain-containing protein [Bacillus sp. FSL R5-0286]|uniref:DUF2716 domain-containing protein n=1 Tax=Bacillus sp. FSL R5-0286 TaxID=2954620 RepID=UPI003157FEC1
MNWDILTDKKNEELWNIVHKKIKWNPGSKLVKIKPPKPYKRFYIKMSDRNTKYNLNELEEFECDILTFFKKCTDFNERIYALEWQHSGYSFSPHLPIELDDFGDWLIPPYPDGDYRFFFKADLEWGVLGDPVQHQIIIYGESLLLEIEKSKPKILKDRKNSFF